MSALAPSQTNVAVFSSFSVVYCLFIWNKVELSFYCLSFYIRFSTNSRELHHHHHHLFAQINCTRRRTHDQHENKSRTRKAQKTGAYILPIKKNKKKQTQSKLQTRRIALAISYELHIAFHWRKSELKKIYSTVNKPNWLISTTGVP